MIVGEAEVLLRPVGGAAFAREAEAESKAGFGRIEQNAAASGARAGQSLKRGLAVGAAAWALLGAGAIDVASKFQSATTSIAANADIPIAKAKQISDAFLGTMGTSIYSANTIAAAYAPVAGQLGAVEGKALGARDSLAVMSAAQNLAEATGSQLGATTQDLANVMQAYHLQVGQAADATDVLFNTSRVTGISIDSLTSLFQRMHSRLGELTPSLAESGGLLNALAKNGVTGRTAMSALNGSFSTLLGGSKTTDSVIQQLGVHVFDSSGKFVGMKSVISQLSPILDQYNQQSQLAITKALFGASANKQLLDVILQGPDAYQRAADAVSKHGSAQDAAAKQAKTFSHQVDVLKATAVDLGIKLGSVLIPVLSTVAHAFLTATNFVTDHKAVLIALGVVITGVLSVAMTAFVANKLIAFKQAFMDAKGAVSALGGFLSGPFSSNLSDAGGKLDAAKGKVAALGDQSAATKTVTATNMGDVRSQYAMTGTSTTRMASTAKTAAVGLGAAETTMVAETATADATMEADNAAAGASFLAIGSAALRALPLIGALYLGAQALKGPLHGLSQDISNATGGVLGSGFKGHTQMTRAQAIAYTEAHAPSWVKGAEVQALKDAPASDFGKGVATPSTWTDATKKFVDAVNKMTATASHPAGGGSSTTGTKQYVSPADQAAQKKADTSAYTNAFKGLGAALQKLHEGQAKEQHARTVAAQHAASQHATEVRKAQAVLAADAKAGQAEETRLVAAAHSTSLAAVKTSINYAHTQAMHVLVDRLVATHQAPLMAMARQIENDYRAAQQHEVDLARQALLAKDSKAGQAELAKLVTAAHSTSLSTLRTAIDATHRRAMEQAVHELRRAHSEPLTKMADNIEREWRRTLAQEASVHAAAAAKQAAAAERAYAQMETKQATALQDLADGSAMLSKAAQDLGMGSATSAAAINAQLKPLGGITASSAAGALGPLITALQAGPLSAGAASGFAAQFGGNSSALGVDLGALGSGKLTPTQVDAETKAIETLIEKMASLAGSVDKNTAATDANTGAAGTGGTRIENIYGSAPGSTLKQLDFQLAIGALPTG